MRKQAGFTLVEVMLSVVILGSGLALVANSYLVALRGINSTQSNIQAALLARDKFTELEILSLENSGLSPSSSAGDFSEGGKNYSWELDVSDISQPDYISKYLVRASLECSWQEKNSVKNVIFSSYFPKQKEEGQE